MLHEPSKTDLDSRSLFLARVAEAVRSGNRHREPIDRKFPESVGLFGSDGDDLKKLAEELTRVGVHVRQCETAECVRRAISELIAQFAAQRVLSNGGPIVGELALSNLMQGADVELDTPERLASLSDEARLDRTFAADLGIAAPDWAIAETGTLVYVAAANQMRSVSLLPPVHVAVVDSCRVLADLMELTAKLELGDAFPRNVALVTGPSKTGDIELRLTTGVHGPGEVHVIIWKR